MHFEYEIPADEYVASNILYYKLTGGLKRVGQMAGWILAGLFFIVLAWNDPVRNAASILLTFVGARWIYGGLFNLFPAWHLRRAYRRSGLAGEKFKAEVSEDGFEVAGELSGWRVRWPAVQIKGENKRVIMLYAAGVLFMFGKKYLTNDQQAELRRLSGLSTHVG